MKKKFLAVALVSAMAVSMIAGCSTESAGEKKVTAAVESTAAESTSAADSSAAESTSVAENTGKEEYQFVSAEDAVKAAADGKTHVLDVREWANYGVGRVADSEWCPIFPLEDESLADQMKTYAEENLKDGQNIYIICNSGQRGAQKSTKVLEEAGIDAALIFTVEGGAKALAKVKGALTTNRAEEGINWQYVKAADVLGKKDAQIVDVRDNDTYAGGHLENSLQVDLKEFESADAQAAMYELAAEKLNKDEPVYFLCYSGNKCAKTAISVLKDAGFDEKNLFIIENGAKDSDIQAAFVK
ncbi:rhodanese-like domain-containing protein [Lacrimispora indolis]|uniref:rhodanese-like domain-containing protein n=1 Tax=Lacrimispora indolis TaxID=69825 RepID=UPI00041AE948|nr:rhodanese-like domain-containing protein [[Clostridium] methoxybenzovorans]